ncbi:MAG: T9SS type A sorting domain-containing protein [Crocinitomicaceae bacterium]
MKHLLFMLTISGFVLPASGQSIKRQSIGSIGTTYHSENITIQQSVGQVYNTYRTDGSATFPGFIQPLTYKSSAESTKVVNQLFVYPNPASSSVQLNLDHRISGAEISVYDQVGRTVYFEKVGEISTYELDCSSWSNGLYIISVKDDSDHLYKSKLIVNH